ncbi:MAG: hypothetical protein EOP04_27445, partial [Proteobacteria bacterium]
MASSTSLAGRFAEGFHSTPDTVTTGINQLLNSTGLRGYQAFLHHAEHLDDFIAFLGEAAFSSVLHKMVTHVAEEAYKEFPKETLQCIAERLAYQAGKTTVRQLLIRHFSDKVFIASSTLERQLAARGAQALFLLLGAMGQLSHSGDAADRLKDEHPNIYNVLKQNRLIGGYYLIED